jgi:NADPH2:quinone reductase
LPFPFIIGRDMVGTVTQIGEDVTRFRPGDRVWANNQGYDGRQGTFAQYCRVEEHLLYHLPAGIEPVEAVTVLHSSLTAILGLFFKANLAAGETLFINGGDGNIGTAILQLAKANGAQVLVTAGNEEKAQWCQTLGADLVINYKTQDVNRAIRDAAPQGVQVYWDATPHFDATRALEVMAQRGRVIVMAGPAQQTLFPIGAFYLRNCTLYGFTVTDATTEELSRYAEQINAWLSKGLPKGKIAQTLPLSQAAQAHQLYETKSLFGKLVLVPD